MFISFCDSVPGDTLVFHQENRGSLRVSLGRKNCSAHSAWESGLIFQRAGSLMVFLELQWEAGVCSRVTAAEIIKNFCLFSDVRTLI